MYRAWHYESLTIRSKFLMPKAYCRFQLLRKYNVGVERMFEASFAGPKPVLSNNVRLLYVRLATRQDTLAKDQST